MKVRRLQEHAERAGLVAASPLSCARPLPTGLLDPAKGPPDEDADVSPPNKGCLA